MNSVSHTLFASMVHDKVHYHTPVHVLYLLAFAQENKVELQNWEKLAIFFHDAIYRPGAKINNNEHSSASLLEVLLNDTGVEREDILDACSAIHQTANHLSDDIKEKYWNVMDLDLSGFAANPSPFNLQNQLIEKEFRQANKKNYGYTLEQFLTGRIEFLTNLKKRKSLYHTELFKTTLRMEEKAQINLDNQIKETERRITMMNKKANLV
jgi:predicted metal-dependent HD superfamily phosphohydrolase